MIEVSFVAGTLELRSATETEPGWLPAGLEGVCVWDPRTRCYRAPALAYADIVRALVAAQAPYEDRARRYTTLAKGRASTEPRGPTRPKRFEAWQRIEGEAWSCCRPAPARPTWRCWPSTTSGAARWWSRPRSTSCANGTTF